MTTVFLNDGRRIETNQNLSLPLLIEDNMENVSLLIAHGNSKQFIEEMIG